MNFFKKFFSQSPKSEPQLKSSIGEMAQEDKILIDCKKFLATGALTEELSEKIAHYKQQDAKISDYEAVELILDHRERQTKK